MSESHTEKNIVTKNTELLASIIGGAKAFDDMPDTSEHRAIFLEEVEATTIEPPKFSFSDQGMISKAAEQIVSQQLALDGRMKLNLASFVTTFIDQDALNLCKDNLTKNLADNDEYPALINIHGRCVNMLANLWNKQPEEDPVGTATTGSSEAIQLGGLAMKRRWVEKRMKEGKPYDKPNIVYPSNVHVSIEKFARYWDVEARVVPIHADNQFGPYIKEIKAQLDENTIGVYAVMGSTYTGHYVDVKALNDMLVEHEKETGQSIDIHVDGASGGMVAPFCSPEVEWDFRLPKVKSINTSGHKFGLAPVGLGWVVFRDRSLLPEHLQFSLGYLGGSELTFTLNFSRPGHPVIAQYYIFLKLGRDGFRLVHENALKNARILSVFLENTGFFEVLSDIHRPRGKLFSDIGDKPGDLDGVNKPLVHYNAGLPVVTFTLSRTFKKEHPEIPISAVSYMLRYHSYIIPSYSLPNDEREVEVLRIVVNDNLTLDTLSQLMVDISKVVGRLLSIESLGKFGSEASVLNMIKTLTQADNDSSDDAHAWSHAKC